LKETIAARRNFLIGSLATLFAAPAIVRATSLMPIKTLPRVITLTGWDQYGDFTTENLIVRYSFRTQQWREINMIISDPGLIGSYPING
jgi:hypothetical protein